MTNDDISIINRGKTSELLLQNFGSYIDNDIQQKLKKMIFQYRSDPTTHSDFFKMIVSEMSATLNLKENLTREVKKANNKNKEIYADPRQ